MKRQAVWLVTAALAVGGALSGCTALCDGDSHLVATFASKAQFADEMAACLQDREACFALCADVFQITGDVRSCDVTSVVLDDLSQRPASRTLDLGHVRGLNLRAFYVDQVACTIDDDGGFIDDGGGDDGDGGDPCDDGSCDDGGGDDGGGDPCDDGSCDDGGGDGDGGDPCDDGSCDDGGGDDGGGDDGGDWLIRASHASSAAPRTAHTVRVTIPSDEARGQN